MAIDPGKAKARTTFNHPGVEGDRPLDRGWSPASFARAKKATVA